MTAAIEPDGDLTRSVTQPQASTAATSLETPGMQSTTALPDGSERITWLAADQRLGLEAPVLDSARIDVGSHTMHIESARTYETMGSGLFAYCSDPRFGEALLGGHSSTRRSRWKGSRGSRTGGGSSRRSSDVG